MKKIPLRKQAASTRKAIKITGNEEVQRNVLLLSP